MAQYQEGQRLRGSDGKTYVVNGGVPREMIAPQDSNPDPIVKGVDPYRERDQQLQEQANARAADAADRAARAEERNAAAAERAVAKDAQGTESERTAGFLTQRLVNGVSQMAKVGKADRSALKPTLGVEATRKVLGDAAANYITDEDRQQVRAAQIDILDSALTLGTGAAYTKEQIEGYRESYFPALGDAPDTIKSKQERLAQLLQAASIKAGRSAPDVKAAMDSLLLLQAEEQDRNGSPSAAAGGLTGGVTDDSPGGNNTPPPSDPGGGGGNWYDPLMAGMGDIAQGAGDLYGIVANPFLATVNAVTGSNYNTDSGQNIRAMTGAPQGNPTISTINRSATAALGGAGLARGAASALNPGTARNALAMFGANPMADTVAGAGAGLGGEVGKEFGPVGQAAGILAGGLAGNAGVNALARSSAPRGPNAMAQAAARQEVDLLPADVGGRGTRIMTSAARSSPFSGSAVERAAQRTQSQLGDAADRAARTQGASVDTQQAGNAVRGAAERFSKQTSERGARLYDQAYEAAKGVRIKPMQTLQAIDQEIARLQQNPAAGSTLTELQSLRKGIEGGVSVQGLRDARSSLSQGVYDGKLRSGSDQAVFKRILDSVADDIDGGLRSVGKENAAGMFRRADKFWSDRVEHIDSVLQPLLGKDRSGEDIVKAIEGMARGQGGGNARLSRLLSGMSDQEAGQVRATLIDRIGKANPGAQDAEGSMFSASTFLTNWNKMTPQAKASVFASKELRQNLNDIAQLAEGTKASQALNNNSNTGAAFMGSAQGAIAMAAGPVKAILGAGSQALTGKLLASPGFARWLARAPKTENPAAVRKYTEQLGVLATREPLIAADARALQQHLQQTFGQSPVRAAAGEKEQDRGRVPPQ